MSVYIKDKIHPKKLSENNGTWPNSGIENGF